MARTPLLVGLRPILKPKARILILGSMPSPSSLGQRQYYAFAQNQFWRLQAEVLQATLPDTYKARKDMLTDHGIALWDVIHSCRRRGALDSRIRDATPNHIPRLLKRAPGIRAIFVNGRTAEKMLERYWGEELSIPVLYLPSSSPANAGMNFSQKRKEWTKIRAYL